MENRGLNSKLINGDCLDVLTTLGSGTVDLVYLDPPFFTQKQHSLKSKDNIEYSFTDVFKDLNEYLSLIRSCLRECKRVLKAEGSIFLHCDKTAAHHLRVVLDEVFGSDNFQSEIIWTYRRWSNAKKGLLNSHQTIYFYSNTDSFKFNSVYTAYSNTTNLDQILQERERNKEGKTIYKKDGEGNVVQADSKKGVPLSDVWDIPFLNPKAKERVGYPTQKPVALLEQIIKIASCEGDTVLDPFCGSGTTCVAAKLLGRNFIGIDKSEEAILLATKRLDDMVVTKSKLLAVGKEAYVGKNDYELAILKSLNALPVQRNSKIDGFLQEKLIPVRIQKNGESIYESAEVLSSYVDKQKSLFGVLVQTDSSTNNILFDCDIDNVKIIKALTLQVADL